MKINIVKIFKYMFTGLYFPVCEVYKAILGRSPLDSKQLLFSSYPDFSDNSKALYQYILQNEKYRHLHFVWLVKNGAEKLPKQERTSFVNIESKYHFGISFSALSAIASSKMLFYTHSSPIKKNNEKNGQTVINLWHGCGYKERKSPLPKKKQFDYGLVPGPVFIDVKSKFWGCQRDQVIPIGYPRYDQIHTVSETTKDYYRRLKGKCERVILWMPTYRKTERNEYAVSKMKGFFELPLVESVEQLFDLNAYCKKKNTLLCVKRHPKQIKYDCEKIEFSNIKFIQNQDLDDNGVDLYGLFACIDGLVTDYSSTAIDFLLLDKPMAFTLNDMESYSNTQGFVFKDPLKYMPGHHIYTYEDYIGFIDDINNSLDPYAENRKQILSETHNPCKCYCERICQYFRI